MTTTLSQLYEEVDAKNLTHRVVASGAELPGVQEISWQFGIARVPTATIKLANPPPPEVGKFGDIHIDVGFNGLTARVFTGKVWNVNPSHLSVDVECVGKSWPLETQYHKVVISLSSITAQQAIEDLLDAAGIIDYKVSMPAWTIGTQVVQTLEFSTYADAISKIAEVDGARWFEGPTGLIRVEQKESIPGLTTTGRVYFAMQLTGLVESYPDGIAGGRPRLRQVGLVERTSAVKNQVFVRGASYTQANADGSENTLEVESDARAPSPWVLKPDDSHAYNDLIFDNELIDTLAKATDVAVRLVTLHNRLGVDLLGQIDGDPEIGLGKTVQVEDPQYSGVTGRWLVESYAGSLSEQDFAMSVALRGGTEIGGALNVSPIALFTYQVEREVIGDREWAIVTLDATASYDPDGTIAAYLWTDNQAPPVAVGATVVLSIRVDPAVLVTPWLVTLTVTDDKGATDVIELEVDITQGAEGVFVPALFVAFDGWFSGSPDGGQNWNDQAYGAGSVISVGSWSNSTPGRAIFGTDDGGSGSLYMTEDYCASPLTQRLNVLSDGGFVHVAWDWRNPLAVWAVTQEGRLYLSQNRGANWALYEDLRKVYPAWPNLRINRIGLPGAGGVWLFGGTGYGQPLVTFDPVVGGHGWGTVAIGGELAADLGAGGGNELYIAEAADRGTGLAIILNSAAFTPAVYFNDDPLGDGSRWTRATGLPAKSRGIWIAFDSIDNRFVFQFNDPVMYLGDVAGDPSVMASAVAAAALDGADDPNYGLPVGPFYAGGTAGAYLVAAEGPVDGTIYKTWDRFANIGKLRPAVAYPVPPAGANGKMISIGRRIVLDERLVAMGTDVSPREVSSLIGVGALWTPPVGVAGIVNALPRVEAITDQLWFAINSRFPTLIAFGWGVGARSQDGGATWGATPDPGIGGGGIMDFKRDAGGRLWCLWHDGDPVWTRSNLSYSDDDGDTWNLSISQGNPAAFEYYRMWKIVPHPSNQNVIAVVGWWAQAAVQGALFWTNDRGSSWVVTQPPEIRPGDWAVDQRYAMDALMLSNGRLVVSGNLTNGLPYRWRVQYTDDEGANWHTGYSVNDNLALMASLFRNVGGDRLAFYWEADHTASPRDHQLWVSTNGGESFARVTLALELQDLVGADFDLSRFTMSPERDAIYFSTEQAINIVKLSPVTPAGIWWDLTDAYPHAFGILQQNMDVVPRPD